MVASNFGSFGIAAGCDNMDEAKRKAQQITAETGEDVVLYEAKLICSVENKKPDVKLSDFAASAN
jgi:hypothetical protein